ncbi:hypothetical protein KVR01_013209 [Diaporthe batatas]|uniref:RNA-dependent ATPase ROK1 n=1 Tax=Diaporthe batatas TaxID=748121 RepID=UPI001D03C41F|nr:RNA-dependent ATPase ROK1 [Diaporthe batatas]KAG8156987.1 hypothetical protein KVR01_013209 [Diaporthe batatas]
MDIFRALSLGTTVRKGGKPAAGGALPSAGSRANAQFYHDDVGSTRGTKRKRADQGGEEESDDDDNDDDTSSLDFFAHKEPTKGTKKAPTQPKAPQKPKPLPKAKLLDEDECKQILRSHRLKFTLLSAGADKKSKVKKSKKKAKASAKEVKPEKKQLFPQPLQRFSELRSTYHISPRLADNIDAQGYREPTEVQMAGLPLLLDSARALGNSLGEDTSAEAVDFMGVAPTGSGKTVSFLIPAINSIMKRRAGSEERKLHNLEAVIVAPTRELANQIHNEGLKLTAGTGVKVILMKKGMRIVTEDAEPEDKDSENESSEESEEEEDSDSGSDEDDSTKPVTKADILVTTPMLLLNFLNKGKLKRTIPSVRSLILDEADVLLDELFRDQTMGIWQACTSPDLHLTFWSATMGSNIETLATEQLRSHHKQRGMAPKPLVRLVVGLKDTAVPNVTHRLTYTATEPGKLYALRQLLRPAPGSSSSEDGPPLRPPFIVFTQTIERATALHDELRYDIPLEAGGSARVAVLHSSLPDAARAAIMRRFRLGEVWVLITTDVLARGVDFAGVNGVVNYDVPTSAAAYVHRAGRTGRAGREGGVAVTLYTKDDMPYIKTFANVIAMSERQAGKGESRVLRALLDALPDVRKEDRKKLKTRGVEARRAGGAVITSKSGWERKKEHNRREAIRESRKRKKGGEAE